MAVIERGRSFLHSPLPHHQKLVGCSIVDSPDEHLDAPPRRRIDGSEKPAASAKASSTNELQEHGSRENGSAGPARIATRAVPEAEGDVSKAESNAWASTTGMLQIHSQHSVLRVETHLRSRDSNGNAQQKETRHLPDADKCDLTHINPRWGRFNDSSWLVSLGCASIMAFCPVLVIMAWIALSSFNGSLLSALYALFALGPVAFAVDYAPRPTVQATLGYAAWLLFQAALYGFLPSQICYGQRTPAGLLLPYRVNGVGAWVVTHALAVALVCAGLLDPAIIAKNWEGLLVAANVYGFFLAGLAYVKAYLAPTHTEDRKFSTSKVYDFYMGIELNPRFGEWWDFKLFHNGRPGIVAWTLIDLSFMAYQYQLHGYITNSIVIVNILHAFYVLDFFYNEDWYLRTIDICHDHYGFYLAWGSMVWLPATYTLQSQFLARYPVSLPPLAAFCILSIGISGYALFRSVNHQKDLVRRTDGDCQIWFKTPEVIRATYLTEDGKTHESILLCSGWWGLVRHANYLGDLVFSYSVCAACGMNGGLLAWWYAIFMTVLLVQRTIRDDERCRGKYGAAWEEYCSKVRWRLVPGIY